MGTHLQSLKSNLQKSSVISKMSSKDMGQQVDIRTLPPEQIQQLSQQINGEIQTLSSAVENFKIVQQKFLESRACIKSIGEDSTEGKEILIPITSSMYVPGRIKNSNKVLIDIGTGYYVEKNRSDADDFCKRKIEQVAKEIGKVQPVLKSRYESKRAIEGRMMELQQQYLQAQKKQKA